MSAIELWGITANHEMDVALRDFVEIMGTKLWENRHKKTVEEVDIPKMMSLLVGEVGEFIQQYMEDKTAPNLHEELADIANFAFLIYMASVKR